MLRKTKIKLLYHAIILNISKSGAFYSSVYYTIIEKSI